MAMRLSWTMVGGALLLTWYFGWLAPLKGLFIIARYLWQGLTALQYQDPGPADNSMIAVLRNATGSDFNQLAALVADFFAQIKEPEMETRLREFVSQRAQRAHPELERTLDWILAMYKFAWPLPFIFLVSKVVTRGGDRDGYSPSSTPGHSQPSKDFSFDSMPGTPSMGGEGPFTRTSNLRRQPSMAPGLPFGGPALQRHSSMRTFH